MHAVVARWATWLAWALVVSGPGAAASPHPAPVHVVVDAQSSSAASGHLAGSCAALAAFPPRTGGAWHGTLEAGAWTMYRVLFNSTQTVLPDGRTVSVAVSQEVRSHRVDLARGPVEVTWRPGGRADALAGSHDLADAPVPTPLSFQATAYRTSTVLARAGGWEYFEPQALDRPMSIGKTVAGPLRLVDFSSATLGLRGDVLVYVEDGGFASRDASGMVGVRSLTTRTPLAPGVFLNSTLIQYATLTLHAADLSLAASEGQAACTDLTATVVGSVHAFEARGSVVAPVALPFSEKEVTLEGAFDWRETQGEGGVRADATGDVRGVLFDFAPVPGWRASATLATVGIGAALLAATAALAWKGVAPLFSRLNEAAVANQPRRRLIVEAVKAKPNITLHELATATGLSQSDVRYHTAILQQHNVIKSYKVLHDRCFVARETLKELGKAALESGPEAVRKRDPVVDAVARHAPPAYARMGEVVGRVAVDQGVSKVAAWKAVHRAVKYGFLDELRIEHEVWVRAKPPHTDS